MKFFLDANIPYSVLELFRELKLEAGHARDIGLGRAEDKEIIRHAIKTKSILVTKDLEFGNPVLFPPKSHYGIIVLRLPHDFKANSVTQVLKDFITIVGLENLSNSLSIVKLGSYRVRKFE